MESGNRNAFRFLRMVHGAKCHEFAPALGCIEDHGGDMAHGSLSGPIRLACSLELATAMEMGGLPPSNMLHPIIDDCAVGRLSTFAVPRSSRFQMRFRALLNQQLISFCV